jgi:hypothetical protein
MATALYRLFCYPLSVHETYAKEGFHLPMVFMLGLGLLAYGVAVAGALRKKTNPLPLSLIVPAILIFTTYAFVRTYIQVWHLTILLLVLLVSLLTLIRERPFGVRAALLLLVAAALLSVYALQFGYFYPQAGVIEKTKEWDSKPGTLKIGCMDSGYLGYFTRHHVVNLDGVVNNAALRCIREGRLQDYIDEQEFDVAIVDTERMKFYNRNMEAPK